MITWQKKWSKQIFIFSFLLKKNTPHFNSFTTQQTTHQLNRRSTKGTLLPLIWHLEDLLHWLDIRIIL